MRGYGWQSDFANSAGPDALVGWDVLIDLGGLAQSGLLAYSPFFPLQCGDTAYGCIWL